MTKITNSKIFDVYAYAYLISAQIMAVCGIVMSQMDEMYPNGDALLGDWVIVSIMAVMIYLFSNCCFFIPAIMVFVISGFISLGMALSPIIAIVLGIVTALGSHIEIQGDLMTWFLWSLLACPIGILNSIISYKIIKTVL